MNARRGLFRLWIVSSVLFAVGVCTASYPEVRAEFAARSTDRDAELGPLVLPADCRQARGIPSVDYSLEEGFCWYNQDTFRRLYPEYNDLTDGGLSERMYKKAGYPITKPRPWFKLFEVAAVAIGVPLAALALGFAGGWIVSGFRASR